MKWHFSWRLWPLLLAFILLNGFFAMGQITATNRFYDHRQSNTGAPDNSSQDIIVGSLVTPGISPPLSRIPFTAADLTLNREVNPRHDPLLYDRPQEPQMPSEETDPLLSASAAQTGQSPPVQRTFEGTAACPGCKPADPVGDVGLNHYVSMANFHVSVFDKEGELLIGPVPFDQIFAHQGGQCGTQNAGDPVVLYDSLADRWLLSQFAAPHHLCVAVSTAGDPTGTYFTYEFDTIKFPDYFKFGVWDDGYYMSANERFYTAYAFDRQAMVEGRPAHFQKFSGGENFLMPADLDGLRPPPADSPHLFYTFKNSTFHGGDDRLELYRFAVDWQVPENSSFDLYKTVLLTPFRYTPCGYFQLNCIPQKNSQQRLDAIAEWPMFRFAYRRFPDQEKMVGAFTVGGGYGEAGAAIRWFELSRFANGEWRLSQEGTHDEGDGLDRFNPSIAMDQNGSIALGYSASSASTYPDIRFAVNDFSDPAGTMRQETMMKRGFASQVGSNRWGDYSAMSIDPQDGCTFFYTNQYYPAPDEQWQIRVGTFALESCTIPAITLYAAPEVQTACVGGMADYEVISTRLAGFDEEIDLSVEGLPNSAAVTISGWRSGGEPQVERANLQLSALPQGSYEFKVMGTAESITTFAPAVLHMLPELDQPLALRTMNWIEQNAEGVALSWEADPHAVFYHLEIARDENFTDLIFSDSSIRVNRFSLSLPPNQLYYWRVWPINDCGRGPVSEIRAFVTAPAVGQCPLGSVTMTHYQETFESGLTQWEMAGILPSWHTNQSSLRQGHFATAVGANQLADQHLISPLLKLPAQNFGAVLHFKQIGNIEGNDAFDICWDGALLEASTDQGATWQGLGDHFLVGGYDGIISSNYGNPAVGEGAWCKNRPNWEETIVDLSSYQGQDIQLRYRLTSDRSITNGDWSLDDIAVQSCVPEVQFLSETAALVGEPGETLSSEIVLQRISLSDERYGMEFDTQWSVEGLLTFDFSAAQLLTIPVSITIPLEADIGARETVQIKVRSQTLPTVQYHHQIKILVDDGTLPQTHQTFLPAISSYSAELLPDLVIENVNFDEFNIQFDVVNVGRSAIYDSFWIDGYINPDRPPAGVNDTHELIAPEGMVWAIDSQDLPLQPGERISLNLTSPQFDEDRSDYSYPFDSQTIFYLQVDSANEGGTFGGVFESHEAEGGEYNNIVGPLRPANR